MRVLHLIKTSVGGVWAYRQMRELVKLGAEIHVALPSGGPLIPRYHAAGIRVHEVDLDFSLSKPQRWREIFLAIRKLVTQIKPDVIHSHNVSSTLAMRLGLGKRHPTPRVFQVPGPLHMEHAIFRWGELTTSGPLDSWIGSCKYTCALYHKAGVSAGKVFLSYYGTDTADFGRSPTGKLYRELALDRRTPLVGLIAYMYAPRWYLGQRRGLKGHEDLIDAFELVLREIPHAHLVLIGGAWGGKVRYERHVRAYAQAKLGNQVHLLGSRDDVPDLYPDLSLAVHPSHSENVGGAIESLLAGIPTIATNVGGFPDIVRPGDTGWLVPPRAPRALATAIIEALTEHERALSLARNGQVLVRGLFDVQRTAREVFQIEQDLATSQA